MSNPVVYFEVLGKDTEALSRFYGDAANGGSTVQPPMDVPNRPTIALFADPEGHVVGLVKG